MMIKSDLDQVDLSDLESYKWVGISPGEARYKAIEADRDYWKDKAQQSEKLIKALECELKDFSNAIEKALEYKSRCEALERAFKYMQVNPCFTCRRDNVCTTKVMMSLAERTRADCWQFDYERFADGGDEA